MIHTLQHLTLYALIALAIASGVEGSDYTSPSSVSIGQKLAQAYGIMCMSSKPRSSLTTVLVFLTVNAFQWGALWLRGNIGGDVVCLRRLSNMLMGVCDLLFNSLGFRLSQSNLSRCVSIRLRHLCPQSLYRITPLPYRGNFRTRDGMPVRRSLQVHYPLSSKLITDFLAALLCVIGGFIAPPERKDTTRAYDNEMEQQRNGGRYSWATNAFNGGSNKRETSYSRA